MKMKKVFSIAMVSVMALSLAACGKKEVEQAYVDSQVEAFAEEVASEILTETTEIVPEEGEMDDGSFFVGEYQADRANLTIEKDGYNFHAHIHWGSSYNEAAEWDYELLYNGVGLVNHGDGVKKIVTYAEDGSVEKEEVEYDNGGVVFGLADGKVTWEDDKETSDEGLAFEKLLIEE